MKVRYYSHLLKSLPLLPLIYFQGKKIKKEIPLLEAAKSPEGFVDNNFKKNLNIIFIGESSFAGLGVEFHKNAFAGHFASAFSNLAQANISWKVYAKTGYNAEKITRKIIPQVAKIHADLLIIGIGGNDSFEFTQPKSWIKNVQLLIDELRKKFPTSAILFAQLPTVEEFPAFTKEMKMVIGNHKNLLADYLNDLVLKNKNTYFPPEKIDREEWKTQLKKDETVKDFFSDGVHPSELTYKLWARDCVKYLEDLDLKF